MIAAPNRGCEALLFVIRSLLISTSIKRIPSILLVLAVGAAAQGSATATLRPEVLAALRGEIGKAESKGITVGFAAAFAESGEGIFAHRERSPLIPASNMKLAIQAAIAYSPLGITHDLAAQQPKLVIDRHWDSLSW